MGKVGRVVLRSGPDLDVHAPLPPRPGLAVVVQVVGGGGGHDHGPQRERHVHAAREGDVPDAAPVRPPPRRLQRVQDLHRPHLQAI